MDYWTPNNPTNEFPRPFSTQEFPQYNTTLIYFDGTFVKLRNVNFGYTFPQKIANKMGMESLRLYMSIQQPKPKIEIVNGSFSVNLEKDRLTKENAVSQMPSWFGLSQNHTFQQVSERTDELGITHNNFQQYFKGFLVEGNLVMLHSKNGKLTSINGQVAQFENIETVQTVNNEQALTTAKSYLKVTDLINNYPVETVITRIPSENGTITKLAQKVRIDSYNPFTMCYVYIDATTGSVLNKINLIAHADVPGTGQTMYSGSQSLTCDSYTGSYRLRENGRKIETYNATNATNLTTSGFTG